MIEIVEPLKELPEGLMVLKMMENPCAKLDDYRKKIVIGLKSLEELDRIKVVVAERMAYQGLIKVDVEALLAKYRKERAEKDAKERMEKELYVEFMNDQGIESSERMMNALEDFAKMDEFNDLHK